jgi:hypothetical protein
MVGVLTLLFAGFIIWLAAPSEQFDSLKAFMSLSPFLTIPLSFVVAFMVGSIFPSGAGILHPNALDNEHGVNNAGRLMRLFRVLKPDKDFVRETLFDQKSLTSQVLKDRVCRLAGLPKDHLFGKETSQQLHDLFELCRFHVMSLPESSAQMDIERHFVLMYFNLKVSMLFFVTSIMTAGIAVINSGEMVKSGVSLAGYFYLLCGLPVPIYFGLSRLCESMVGRRRALLGSLQVILVGFLTLITVILCRMKEPLVPSSWVTEIHFLWTAQVCYVLSRVSGRRAQGNYRRWHRLIFTATIVSKAAPFRTEQI